MYLFYLLVTIVYEVHTVEIKSIVSDENIKLLSI